MRFPIAPGLFQEVRYESVRTVGFGEPIVIEGPCALALDGERELVLAAGQTARLRIERQGPWVIDSSRVMRQAAAEGWFRGGTGSREDAE